MFILEITLKHTPVTLSVQKKTGEDAESTYQQIVTAIRSGSNVVLELVCDHQVGKKVAVMSGDIAAAQMYEKSSTATASGRPPGFFAMAE
jgi:hypothetical protein